MHVLFPLDANAIEGLRRTSSITALTFQINSHTDPITW
jgi:hypothetical protein